MLAGIFSDDLGVPEEWIDSEQARYHLTQISALWPDSDQAAFVKKALRWDQSKGQHSYEHYPRKNEPIVGHHDS